MRRSSSPLPAGDYFQQRAGRADRAETLRILKKAGRGSAPMKGDELPADGQKRSKKSRRSTPRSTPSGSEGNGRGAR